MGIDIGRFICVLS